jgi:hypothetical protein
MNKNQATASGNRQSEKQRRGPSISAIASLVTLAVSLWFEVELSSALFRAVAVYLGLSMLGLVYRAILSHYLAASEQRARQEMLEKLAREAEDELRKQKESKEKQPVAKPMKTVKASAGAEK